MLTGYLPILVMLIASGVLAGGMVIGSAILGPKHPTKYKNSSYECGMTPVGSARERFPIKFFIIAMLFIIFDIETIFLYPWAVTFRAWPDRGTKFFMLGEMAVFLVILLVGYAYVWGTGVLDWDEGNKEDIATHPGVLKPRKPIRFGNENSGPASLPSPSPAIVVAKSSAPNGMTQASGGGGQ